MRRWIRLSGTVQQTLFIAVAQERGPAHYVREKYTLYKWLNLGRAKGRSGEGRLGFEQAQNDIEDSLC
jgi:hypothetical protein